MTPSLTHYDIRAVELAIIEAHKSQHKQRHGAVIYKRATILSVGYNRNKTHPKIKDLYEYPFIHAEYSCLIRANGSVKGYTMVVVRINRRGELLNSKPCPACFSLIQKAEINCLVYSSTNTIEKVMLG